MLAYGTDGFLIGTAMRPHAGIGQNMAHQNIATGVVSHTLTFHEPIETGRVVVDGPREPVCGPGGQLRAGQVFTRDGRLVASFVQENMIRDTGTSDS